MARGAGLLVLGGYNNLGNGDWRGSALANLLPVDLTAGGQVEKAVRMVPTGDGLRRVPYLFRLDDDPRPEEAWAKLATLDGVTELKLPPPDQRGLDQVLAAADDPEKTPVLVMRTYAGKAGAGRREGGPVAHPRLRRRHHLPLGPRPQDPADPRPLLAADHYLAGPPGGRQRERLGPAGRRVAPPAGRAPTSASPWASAAREAGPTCATAGSPPRSPPRTGRPRACPCRAAPPRRAGLFQGTKQPGTYRVTVTGEGKEASGEAVSGQASARVIVYDEDLELLRPAADPEFMRKLGEPPAAARR